MRKPRVDKNNKATEVEQKNSTSVVCVDDKPKFTEVEIKTFKQQACEVLDILDKTGDGIYNEGRYAGMYLKHNKTTQLSEKIIKNSKKEQNNQNEENIKLLNFFKQKNK